MMNSIPHNSYNVMKKITPEQFMHLKRDQQESLVYDEGVFIALRQEPEFIIHLYQLETFYVELYFHQLVKAPVSIRTFSNTMGLDPYLSGMDLCFD